MKLITNRRDAAALVDARYGSVWETAGPATGLAQLSVAHAEVEPGKTIPAHYHARMSEVYHIVSGYGTMLLDGVPYEVGAGDTISLPPGTVHSLINTGAEPVRLLVSTSPSYDVGDDHEI